VRNLEAEAQLVRLKIYMVLAILGCILLFASFMVLAANYIYKTEEQGEGHKKLLIRLLARCRLWRHLGSSPPPRGDKPEAVSNNSLQLLTYSYSRSNTLTYSFQFGDGGGFGNTVEQADSHESLLHGTTGVDVTKAAHCASNGHKKRSDQHRGLAWTWQKDRRRPGSNYRPVRSFDDGEEDISDSFLLENHIDPMTHGSGTLLSSGYVSDVTELSAGLTALTNAAGGPVRVQGALLVLLLDNAEHRGTGSDLSMSRCEDDDKNGDRTLLNLTCDTDIGEQLNVYVLTCHYVNAHFDELTTNGHNF
jgi:hypothetical protein